MSPEYSPRKHSQRPAALEKLCTDRSPGRTNAVTVSDVISRIVGQPAPTVSEIALDGELSLFDESSGTALMLNRTASDIWAMADGRSTVGEVVSVLARAYGTSPEQIADDVAAVLLALEDSGVLVRPADR